jgi:quercetin dioxygenase-like cupin family protein
MALTHAGSGDLLDIGPLGPVLLAAKSHTLVRSPAIEIFRMVLPAGKTVAPHRVPGAITIQCLEGEIEFEAHGRSNIMRAAHLVYLEPLAVHALKAIEDSSVLVTLTHAGERTA